MGISIVGEAMRRQGSAQKVYNEVREWCVRARSHGHRLRLIPFCKNDVDLMLELRRELSDDVDFVDFWQPPISGDLNMLLARIAECTLLIGERLHAAVLAAAMNVPFISIGYKSKCRDFADSVGAGRYLIDPVHLSHCHLWNMFQSLLRDGDTQAEIAQHVHEFRSKLKATAAEITELIHRHAAGVAFNDRMASTAGIVGQ